MFEVVVRRVKGVEWVVISTPDLATPLEASMIALIQQTSYLRSVGGDDEGGFGFGGLRVPVGRN